MEKIEFDGNLNGIDDMKKVLCQVVEKVNEMIEVAVIDDDKDEE